VTTICRRAFWGLAVLLALPGLGSAEDSTGWVWGPAFKEGWKPHFTFAATVGYLDPNSNAGTGNPTVGAQVSLDCPWFLPPKGDIRQEFNFNHYNDGNLNINSLEMNPRYFVTITPSLIVGVGPGVGYVWADSDVGRDATMWAVQLGFDVEYRYQHLFVGLGGRYQWTQDHQVGLNDRGVDNWLTLAKVGVTF
jgi:hypothetical protein